MSEPEARQGPYQTTTPVAYIAHEAEEMVHVRRAELRQWANEVVVIAKNPLEHAQVWTSTCLAVAVTAGLTALGMAASESSTNHPPELAYVIMLAVTLASFIAAAFAGWVDRQQRKDHTSRAQTLSSQITAADTRSPRDPVVVTNASLSAWLDGHSADIRKLKEQIEAQLKLPTFDHESVKLTEQMFWQVNSEVMLKLHVAAPEWVDYYKQNPDWWVQNVMRTSPEEFGDVVRVIDYTLDQIAHVREQVT
jgi:hypothetical protein